MHVLLEVDGEEFDLYLVREGDVVKVEVGGETLEAKLGVGTVTIGDRTFQVEIGEQATVKLDGRDVPFRVADFQSGGAPGAHNAGASRAGKVKPPMPGKIVSVAVQEGQDVVAGQLLLVLEAMKMQNEITAPGAGKVKKVNVKPGQNVEAKDVLVELE
jgi:pyruvate carboxylase